MVRVIRGSRSRPGCSSEGITHRMVGMSGCSCAGQAKNTPAPSPFGILGRAGESIRTWLGGIAARRNRVPAPARPWRQAVLGENVNGYAST